jgi:hypothetical protein
MAYTTGDNNYGTARFIVGASGTANYTTIASALTAAVSGDTIFILPGTYTENLTLKAGVNLTAYNCDAAMGPSNGTFNVTILGKCTFTAAGTVSMSGICLETNSDFALAVTGSAASIVNLSNCYLNCNNNTGISYTTTNAASTVNLIYCNGNLATTGIGLFAHSGAGQLNFWYGYYNNSGGSTTASTVSSSGSVIGLHSIFYCPFSTSGSSSPGFGMNYCSLITSAQNATPITINGTGTSATLLDCSLFSGSASAISVGASAILLMDGINQIDSTNTNAITGSGTINYSLIEFSNTSSTVNTTTQTKRVLKPTPKIVTQTFTGSGTYTVTPGMVNCIIEVCGGGGGGGGTTTSTTFSVGGGGGGGGYARKLFTSATIGASQTVTIGTAGTAGAVGGGTGGTGGTTSVGALISATGGAGGVGGISGGNSAAGGAGGVGSSGDFNTTGNYGGMGVAINAIFYYGGFGGSSFFGGNGNQTGGTTAAGSAALSYGGGGGGAIVNNGTQQAGGAGFAGIVYITEFIYV